MDCEGKRGAKELRVIHSVGVFEVILDYMTANEEDAEDRDQPDNREGDRDHFHDLQLPMMELDASFSAPASPAESSVRARARKRGPVPNDGPCQKIVILPGCPICAKWRARVCCASAVSVKGVAIMPSNVRSSISPSPDNVVPMPTPGDAPITPDFSDQKNFINRELSWLEFNRRVL